MQPKEPQLGPPEVAGIIDHSFEVTSYKVCVECHGTVAGVEYFVALVRELISNEIQEVKSALDQWAVVKQGGMLGTNYYGALAWEYTNPGDLSSGTGPSSTDQALIPDNIKKARFNLYLVLYDGSYGVHNGPYAFTLLGSAREWVQKELNK